MSADARETPQPVVRGCGPCQMCCRVFPVPEAGKFNTDRCSRLIVRKGCSVYPDRPQPCRDFFCLWTRDASLGEEWRPDIAGFVLSDPGPWSLLVTNDPDRPDAWRAEPYQPHIRAWAHEAGLRGQFAGVREGKRLMLVFASGEHEISEDAAGPR